MNVWDLNIGQGWRLGLLILAGLVLLAVWLISIVATSPITIWTFLMGLVCLGCLLAAVQMGYWLWGLINARYLMDRNALLIRWGQHEHQVPMQAVRAVVSGAEIENVHIRSGIRWPGHFVGYGEAEEIGPILFYATRPLNQQVIVRTETMAYGISPTDLNGFLTAFRERLEMGPTQEVTEMSRRPSFVNWSIWGDRWALGTLGGSVLLLTLLLGLLMWQCPHLPAELALRMTPDGQFLLVTTPKRIFYLALLGGIFLLLNGTLGLLLYRRQKTAAYFVWSGLLVLQSSLWIAVISILARN